MFDFIKKTNGLFMKNKEGRNVSILQFNYRLLNLAKMDKTPQMEKLNFLKIIYSNIDEFISIRLPESEYQQELIEIIEDLYSEMYSVYKEFTKKLKYFDKLDFRQSILGDDCLLYVVKIYDDKHFEILDPLSGLAEGNKDIAEYHYLRFIKDRSFNFVESYDTYRTIEEEILQVIKIKENDNFKYVCTDCTDENIIMELSKELNIDGSNFILCKPEVLLIDKIYDELKSLNDDCSLYFKKDDMNYSLYNYETELSKTEFLFRTPYDSYKHVIDFINQMCESENISTICMTIYRIGNSNSIVDALIRASKSGKQVFVYIETTARGDEERNLEIIKMLRISNVKILKKYPNFKCHAKCFCSISKNGEIYTHIGTGNYNEVTSNFYTDLHLITSDYLTGVTALSLFGLLSDSNKSYSKNTFPRFTISPFGTREELLNQINNEKEFIRFKCNSLCDTEIISALYDASARGVKIELLVRTACTVEPSDNIEVRSKVGQYLEHDRIYIFSDKAYISSADLLTRNLSKRIEILYQLNDTHYDRVNDIFESIWDSDTCFQITR